MHAEVQASLAWFEFRVWGLVDIVIPSQFSFIGGLAILNGGKDVEIFLFWLVLVLIFCAVTVFLFGLECLGDCVEAVLVAGACSFGLADHESYIN